MDLNIWKNNNCNYNTVVCCDCLDGLKELQENSINMLITSPPYYGLRDYGVENQLGHEQTPEEYIQRLVDIFKEVKRVLTPDDTIWLNLGDTYYSKGYPSRHYGYSDPKNPKGRTGKFIEPQTGVHEFYKPKDLMGIPHRVAFALQEKVGLYFRQTIIWHKPNAMPAPVKDRPSTDYEYLFLFSKSEKYYYDYKAVQEISIWADKDKRSRIKGGKMSKGKSELNKYSINKVCYSEGGKRNLRSVWSINTKGNKDAHFAMFPVELITKPILAGCPKGGIVLDIFAGAGTTGKVAQDLERQYLLFDVNSEYCKLSKQNIQKTNIKKLHNYFSK